jgi:hypothetical protein
MAGFMLAVYTVETMTAIIVGMVTHFGVMGVIPPVSSAIADMHPWAIPVAVDMLEAVAVGTGS